MEIEVRSLVPELRRAFVSDTTHGGSDAASDVSSGRVAQWESARLTNERLLVRAQPRPSFALSVGRGLGRVPGAVRFRWDAAEATSVTANPRDRSSAGRALA